MAEHYKLKTNTHSSCVIGTPENDAHRDALGCSPRNHIFVWLPPSECEGHCFAWIHKDNLGEMIPKEDFHQHRADWFVEKVNKLKEELEESEKEKQDDRPHRGASRRRSGKGRFRKRSRISSLEDEGDGGMPTDRILNIIINSS